MQPASHRLSRASIAALLLAVALASRAGAQCPTATWSAFDRTHQLDGLVQAATTWDPDGVGPMPPVLVIGGQFQRRGDDVPRSHGVLLRVAHWEEPNSVLSLSQPGGPGAGLFVANSRLIPGNEYYNIASVSLCPGCVGSGPYSGLCFDEFSFLQYQLGFAVGSYPFHFLAPGASVSTGPYFVAAGSAFDALCADVTGGNLGCISRVVRFTIQ